MFTTDDDEDDRDGVIDERSFLQNVNSYVTENFRTFHKPLFASINYRSISISLVNIKLQLV